MINYNYLELDNNYKHMIQYASYIHNRALKYVKQKWTKLKEKVEKE